MLKTLGMFNQIFPGLSVLSSQHKIRDYKIQIAYMLQTNGADKVKKRLNGLKYTNQEAHDIWFLITISNPREVLDDLPSFKKLQQNTKLTTSQIKQWAKIHGDKNILKVWNWKLSVSSKEAIDKGWLGAGIGKYIRQKEEELFLKR